MNKVIVGGWNAIDEILEDDSELSDELLRFLGDGEGFVVYSCEIEVIEDFVDVGFFVGRFVFCNYWFGL